MRNLLSKRAYCGELPETRLNAIWYVDADETYSVNRWNRQNEGCVAVRTITGMGRLELSSGEVFSLSPDSLGFFNNGQISSYSSGKDGWQFYWFEFMISGGVLHFPKRTVNLRLSAQEQIEMERCFQTLNQNSVCECMMAEALFRFLLADWQARATQKMQNGIPVQNLLALLEMGRRERIGIAELARKAGMCERSFREVVRRATGLPPKAYMLKGEMAAAMELITTTDMTVSEIASLFNYSSPFYFSRVFRQFHGVSPSHVRDENP